MVRSVHISHLLTGLSSRERRRFSELSTSIQTDGVQCHVPVVQAWDDEVWVREDKAVSMVLKAKDDGRSVRLPARGGGDIPSPDVDRFKTQRHGLFTATAIQDMTAFDGAGIGNLVFADPGVRYTLQGASVDYQVWRQRGGHLPYYQGDFIRGQTEVVNHLAVRRSKFYALTGATQHNPRNPQAYDDIFEAIDTAERQKEPGWERQRTYAKKQARHRGWRPQAVKDAAELLSHHPLCVGDSAAAWQAAEVRTSTLLDPRCWWRFHGSRTHAQLRFERQKKKTRGLEELVREMCPKPSDVLVLGAWGGRRALKGERLASPIATIRRFFSQRRRVLILNETKTSCTCGLCGTRVTHPSSRKVQRSDKEVWKAAKRFSEAHQREPTPAEMEGLKFRPGRRTIHGTSYCPRCRRCLPRDVNATLNFSRCLHHMASNGGLRPPHLTSSRQRTAD
jgi:hypothetical protein